MSLNLTNPVTTDGVLKLTQAEYDYLQSFLTASDGGGIVGDRGGYYMALYNMTGSQEALLQAEISTFSEGAGGAAYLANHWLKATQESYKAEPPPQSVAIFLSIVMRHNRGDLNEKCNYRAITDGGAVF